MTASDAPQRQYRDDEISLVDLAVILLRRWKSAGAIFFSVVFLSLVFAFFHESSYRYTSIYKIAEYTKENGEPVGLESPDSVVAKAKSFYAGADVRSLIAGRGLSELPFDVEISNPQNTLMVEVVSEAKPDEKSLVDLLHENILNHLEKNQKLLVEKRKKALQQQLEATQKALEAAQQSTGPNASELVASYFVRVSNLKADIDGLTGGEVAQKTSKSLDTVGAGPALIAALGLLMAVIFSVIGAFLIEFLSAVRRRAKEGQ